VPGRSVTSMWYYAKFSGGRSRKGGNQPLDRKWIGPEKFGFPESGIFAHSHVRLLEAFPKQLRGRTPLVNLHPYADWMSVRTHRKLLDSR
jgi:hypothetical protein